jgi:hypothetical protein
MESVRTKLMTTIAKYPVPCGTLDNFPERDGHASRPQKLSIRPSGESWGSRGHYATALPLNIFLATSATGSFLAGTKHKPRRGPSY